MGGQTGGWVAGSTETITNLAPTKVGVGAELGNYGLPNLTLDLD